MQTELVARRKQFSSCDECRRLRVRCDALSRSSGPCARCLRRHKRCTFEWMNDVKPHGQRRASLGTDRARHQSVSSTGSNNTSSSTTSTREASRCRLDSILSAATHNHGAVLDEARAVSFTNANLLTPSPLVGLSPFDCRLVRAIYLAGFDTIFGSWMSRYGCPFLSESSVGEDRNSIADVCERLDRWMADMSQSESNPTLNCTVQERSMEDNLIDDSLRSTIAAFSARWLPLAAREPHASSGYQNIVHALWRHARRDMLRVINRPSYRSMLALFLFAMTPVPAEISDDEEADGIFGQVCIHAALQQIQTLRARQRSLQFNGTKVSQPSKPKAIALIPETVGTTDFITAENIAYWAAITFDTSASLTLNCRSLLSSGLFGFEAEMPWRLVRAGATMFQNKREHWDAQGAYDMTDDRANQIIAGASAWKLFTWKLTAVFKEALRDGHDESEVQRAFSLVLEGIQQFNETYREPLEACQKRMPFLGQHTKFRWFSLMLHYHLSILLLANIIEATDRLDLLADIEETIADAESVVVNALLFGLHNTIRMTVNMESGVVDHVGATETSVTVPVISLDPYPHHIVAGVQLVQKAVDRDLAIGKISQSAHESLRGLLERTLSHLPQSSKSVKAAKESFSKVLHCTGEQPPMPYSVC